MLKLASKLTNLIKVAISCIGYFVQLYLISGSYQQIRGSTHEASSIGEILADILIEQLLILKLWLYICFLANPNYNLTTLTCNFIFRY